jgi:hypothetical protein
MRYTSLAIKLARLALMLLFTPEETLGEFFFAAVNWLFNRGPPLKLASLL